LSKHPIDQWDDEANEYREEAKKQALLESSLVFAVFSTEPGKKLINKWRDLLMDSPSAGPGMGLLEIGMNEGEKRFVRYIINSIKTHEES